MTFPVKLYLLYSMVLGVMRCLHCAGGEKGGGLEICV